MGLADVVAEFDEDVRVYIDRQGKAQSRTKSNSRTNRAWRWSRGKPTVRSR